MIKTVVFDIGNVLMDFDYMPYVRSLLQDEEVVGHVNTAIWHTGLWDEMDAGVPTEEVLSRMVAADPDYEEEIRRAFLHVGDCMFRCDYAIPWIRSLREAGYQVLYLSNYAHHTMQANPGVLDFLPYMDGGIFSCDERVKKPDEEIFRRLFHRYDLVPSECVFLDDNEANIKAAKNMGMQGIHFTDYESTKPALDALLSEQGTPGKIMRWEHPVLRTFSKLCRYPHESGNEWPLSNWIHTWAVARGIQAEQDDIGNLILLKPGTPGYEEHPAVMLQAHLDMVCEKNAGSTHDFAQDPILLEYDGEWIRAANGTSLGADNGIGVAAALSILEDAALTHPPLEAVFTVQEETTFAGAEKVEVSGLAATRMINLDHADERELVVGSCGGTGARLAMPIERSAEDFPEHKAFRIMLRGLQGGHSGEDIHRGRGNAIKLMLRVLEKLDLPVVDLQGGSNRLAIPREAQATVLAENEGTLRRTVRQVEAVLRKEYGSTAPDLALTAAETEDTGAPLTEDSFRRLCALLRVYPNGIIEMSGSMPGLVGSSDNIGVLRMEEKRVLLESEARGAYQSAIDDVRQSIEAAAALCGGQVRYYDSYVPWEPSASSPLRKLAADTYREMYGEGMTELALHAGLECGFFAEKMPGAEMIAIGPDCQSFHSPEERVRAASVERFYEYLKELVRRL